MLAKQVVELCGGQQKLEQFLLDGWFVCECGGLVWPDFANAHNKSCPKRRSEVSGSLRAL